MPDLMPLARAEREDFLALVRDLDRAEWDTPSLCAGWTVRDVVAHVFSYDERSWPATAGLFIRGGLRFGKINEVALHDYRHHTPEQLTDLVERCLIPSGLPAGFKGGIALTDSLIHQQDVRRPLSRPRAIPDDRLHAALSIAMSAPTLPTKRNVKGLRLRATDLDWAYGDGPAVTGPAEALLMAATGRPAALAELDGAGLSDLRQRLNRHHEL